METKASVITVKRYAEYLGVTRQTVYNYLNELQESVTKSEYNKYVRTLKGSLHITPLGQEVLRDMYLRKNTDEEETAEEYYREQAEKAHREQQDAKDKLIEILTEQLKRKDEIISHQLQHMNELTERLREDNYLNLKALEAEAEKEQEETQDQEEAHEEVQAESFIERLKYLFTGKHSHER